MKYREDADERQDQHEQDPQSFLPALEVMTTEDIDEYGYGQPDLYKEQAKPQDRPDDLAD